MIIGVAALVAAFAITDGVAVWSRDMLARESSVQNVAVTPVTVEIVNGRARPVRGYPVFEMEDADRAGAEVAGVMRYALIFADAPIYPVVRPLTALLAVASAVVVGVVFGTYPARLASRLSPVDVISRE